MLIDVQPVLDRSNPRPIFFYCTCSSPNSPIKWGVFPAHHLRGLRHPRSCSSLPGLDATGNDPKDRVRLGALYASKSNVALRIAQRELRHEVTPLVLELSAGHGDRTGATRRTDLSRGELVATLDGFFVHAAKIVRDRPERRRLSAKSLQLWVVEVSLRAPPEHRLRQEPFSPQGHQPAGVEVLRMQ